MADPYYSERRISEAEQPPRRRLVLYLLGLLFLLLVGSRFLASTLIDYQWWSEMGQTDTWFDLYLYGTGPSILAFLLFAAAFWTAFKLGIRSTGNRPLFGFLSRSLLSKIALLATLVLAFLLANITVNSWAVVRYFGGLRLPPSAGGFVDPIFHHSLAFYFFSLPFYQTLLRVVLVGSVFSLIIYGLASNAENLSNRLPTVGSPSTFDFERISFNELFRSQFVRLATAIFLLGLAAHYYLDRFSMLLDDHGTYLVGVDWVADHIGLPLQWLLIAGGVIAAALVLSRQAKWALALLLLLPVRYVLPSHCYGTLRTSERACTRTSLHPAPHPGDAFGVWLEPPGEGNPARRKE